jgi:hypothetical protein
MYYVSQLAFPHALIQRGPDFLLRIYAGTVVVDVYGGGAKGVAPSLPLGSIPALSPVFAVLR